MDKPNDVLLGLTRYVRPIFLVFLLLCVSHLILPFLASLNSASHLFEKADNHISFLYDWPYHLTWAGIIPATIMLIYAFHRKTKEFVQDILRNYRSNYDEFTGRVYIPVISLVITSAISFLIYTVSKTSYIEARMSTWWFPEPKGAVAASTVFFYVWSAVIGSTALVYLIDHLAVSIYLYRLLRGWTKEVILRMKVTELLDKFSLMIKHFESPVYILIPGVILGCITIVARRTHLDVKFTDPTVIIIIILMTLGLFLLYVIPLMATGLTSKIDYAKLIVKDERVQRITKLPPHLTFYWAILAPIWSGMGAKLADAIVKWFNKAT